MFKEKCLSFTILLQMILIIEGNRIFHSDMADLRDVMRKDEIQNELNDLGTYEHRNPSVTSQNDIIQNRNAIVSAHNPLQTFTKEFPIQQTSPQVPAPLPAPRSNIMEYIIQPEESELRKSEKANEAFEKVLQFMTIVSQVDEYLTDKTQSAIKTIARIAEESSNNQRNRFY